MWISLNTPHRKFYWLHFLWHWFCVPEAHFGLDLWFHNSCLYWRVSLPCYSEWARLLECLTEALAHSFIGMQVVYRRKKSSKNSQQQSWALLSSLASCGDPVFPLLALFIPQQKLTCWMLSLPVCSLPLEKHHTALAPRIQIPEGGSVWNGKPIRGWHSELCDNPTEILPVVCGWPQPLK